MPGFGEITQETIDMTRGIIQGGPQALRSPTSAAAVKTGITVGADYLYGYPLEAPSKKLYPIEDAMRRRVPRFVNPMGGLYAHWKQITAINSGKIKAGVAEGAVNTAITLTNEEKSAKYKTLSMYNTYSDESRFMGRKFEDIPAYAMLALLQSLMIEEDIYIIGGSDAEITGSTNAPTGLAAAASSGSLTPGSNYYFAVSALNLHGYLNGANGRATGDSNGESQACAAVGPSTGSSGYELTWADVKGAFAYNVYCYTSATVRFIATVTTNKYTVTALGASTNVVNVADQTRDVYGYAGLMQQICNLTEHSGLTYGTYGTMTAYYKSMDGEELNGDMAAGVVEIDEALQSIWNSARISPTVMLANAQEARSLKALAIGNAGTNAARIMVAMDGQAEFKAGAGVTAYYNPFTAQWIPIVVSTHMAPGTLMLLGERVPYPNSETPNNFEVELQQEYYGEEFARVARSQPIGATCIGALKLYFPPACGIIKCIAPTT